MNCQEALDQLYALIDKESAHVDETTLRIHLSQCSDCAGIYKVEEAVNEFVQARLRNNLEPVTLSKLKARILEELDSSDCTDDNPCSDAKTN